MRALKVFNIVMAVVLVAGFAIVIAVIAARLSQRGRPAGGPRSFAGGTIELPRGARIEAMTAAADRLVLDVVLPDGNRELLFVDLATGVRLGAIELRPPR
ncbi:MAG: DUF6476 family protein [Stellaceae bacterium]